MSRVQAQQELDTSIVEESKAEVTQQEHVRRVVVECNATGNELRHGQLVKIANAEDVFKPQSDEKVDYTKGIVTGISLRAVSSRRVMSRRRIKPSTHER